jgi:hypothetical protein
MRRRETQSDSRRRIASGAVPLRGCMIRLHRDEGGAVLPLMAALIAGLVIAAVWAANVATMVGVRREHQRAANLSALAGAANIPLTGLLAPDEPQTTACDQAERLLTPAAAPLSNNLAATAAGPTCVDGVTVEPLFDWSVLERTRNALAQLLGPVQAQNLCGPLRGLLDPLLGTLGAGDCARLEAIIDAAPDNLAPAALTPRVRVTIRERVEAPIPMPGIFDGVRTIDANALARRRFKNVVVVPAVRTSALGLPQIVNDLISGAPADLTNLNLNTTLADVRNRLMPRLWQANEQLRTRTAGQADFSQFLLDMQDLYDPPAGGATPPSPLEVAQEAIRRGEPVFIVRAYMTPLLGIPAFDFTTAYLTPLANGNYRAVTPVPVADLSRANGLFGATLVR